MTAVPLPAGDRWFTELLTARLRISRLTPDDSTRLVAYRNDPDVAVFQDWPMPFTAELADELIDEMERLAPCIPGEWFQFGLFDRSDGRLIGDVGLSRDGSDPTRLTIGYTVARGEWGKGLATEALTAILDHAVAITGATVVTAEALAANEPSVRLLRRLGFEEVDRIPRAEQIDGAWQDEVFYEKSLAPPDPAIAAILVGGASRRMGAPKPQVEIGGAPMFGHVEAALTAAGLEVLVVGTGAVPTHHHQIVPDAAGRSGPVAGIFAALGAAGGRSVFVTAVDQPYLSPPTIRRLLALDGDLVVPLDDGRAQVTCAVYRPAFADRIRELLDENPAPSLQELALADGEVVPPDVWRSWGEDGRSWRSLDTPGAVSEALDQLGDPVGAG